MTKKITWQGEPAETDAATVAACLEERKIDAAGAVVEWNGEMFAPGDDLAAVPLADGGSLSVFKVVAGG